MITQKQFNSLVDVGWIEIERDPIEGVIVKAQSKEIHAFFKKLATAAIPRGAKGENAPEFELVKTSKKWGLPFRYYNIPPQNLPLVADVTFTAIGEGMFVQDQLNLSFLRAEALGEGVEIVFTSPAPIAESVKESFRKGSADRVQELYGNYIKPSWSKVVLTSETYGRL